jgi:hypothetical protein
MHHNILEVGLFRDEASTCLVLLIDVFRRSTLGLRDWKGNAYVL